jgi:hypothetical protein
LSGKPVAVERNMTGLIPENQTAHVSQRRVFGVPAQQSIVDGACDFGE